MSIRRLVMDIKGSRLYLLTVIFLFILTGCSHSYNPVTANETNDTDAIETPVAQAPSMPVDRGNRVLWGYWDVSISPDDLTIEAIPDRASAMHFNVVRLIEVTPCPYCLKIENIQWQPGNIVEADFRLQHPFPGLDQFTGFDVRGIFISEADYLFPEMDRRMAYGTDIPKLLDPDGYTSLFNPTEFPEGTTPFPILGYITGKYSTGGPLSTTLNPYVAYGTENPRRLFAAGSAETRKVRVHYSSLPIQFGYAVDASWFPVDEVIDPVTDFPIEANCPEAFKIEILNQDPIELSSGASIEINFKIYDHQGIDSISCVTMESPEIFNGVVDCVFDSETGPDSWLFKGRVNSACGLGDGIYPVLVRVEDTASDPNFGKVDAYQVFDVLVTDYFPGGWVRTWGAAVNQYDKKDAAVNFAVTIDLMDNIYTGGWFSESINFDPLCGEVRFGIGKDDAFLVKMDTSGNFEWAQVWGGEEDEMVLGIATDVEGNVYAAGWFEGLSYLAPGFAEPHESHGRRDAFLCKFNSSGDFQWARSWGGTDYDDAKGIVTDNSGCVYVVGAFSKTVIFGPDKDSTLTSTGGCDMYLVKYDSSGNYLWVTSAGAELNFYGNGIAFDPSGYVYIVGDEKNEGDGSGFLQKLDLDSNVIWTRYWGEGGGVFTKAVAVGKYGNVYVTGRYVNAPDFDPFGGDVHYGAAEGLIFLSMYNSNGSYRWTQTWGAQNNSAGLAVATDNLGNIFVSGGFEGEGDMNPNGGNRQSSHTGLDAFVSRFTALSRFRWVQTWGGLYDYEPPIPFYDVEQGYSVATDSSGNVYVVGSICVPCDFTPDNPSCGNETMIARSRGEWDAYIVKYLPDGCW